MRTHMIAAAAAAVAGVTSFGFALWGAPFRTAEADTAWIPVAPVWLAYAVAGLLAILSLPMTARNVKLARVMLGLGGLTLIAGALALGRAPDIAWTAIIPGLVMLAAAPFLGRRPARLSEAERAVDTRI